MEFNPEVINVLRQHQIDKDTGLLALLAVYHGLNPESIIPEEVIKAINLTKIVDKDYSSGVLVWNVALFEGEETAFGWVQDWIGGFKKINPDRVGSYRDAISRMKDFFSKYPEYRKDDVYAARDMYFRRLAAIGGPAYCMKSHKFIFDGSGVMKKSTLLEYCEKVRASNSSNTESEYKRGDIIS